LHIRFSGGSDGKESACNAGDSDSIHGLGRSPGERNGNSLLFLPGEFHGQRSLVGHSPRGCKELDMTDVKNRQQLDDAEKKQHRGRTMEIENQMATGD